MFKGWDPPCSKVPTFLWFSSVINGSLLGSVFWHTNESVFQASTVLTAEFCVHLFLGINVHKNWSHSHLGFDFGFEKSHNLSFKFLSNLQFLHAEGEFGTEKTMAPAAVSLVALKLTGV